LLARVPRATIHERLHLHALSPAGDILATSEDRNAWPHPGPIQLWDVQTGQRRLSLAGDWSAVRSVEFSPRGTLLAVVDQDEHLTIRETATGKEVARFVELERKEGSSQRLETRFSPDDRFLAIEEPRPAGPIPSFVLFWDVKAKAVRARIEGHLSG